MAEAAPAPRNSEESAPYIVLGLVGLLNSSPWEILVRRDLLYQAGAQSVTLAWSCETVSVAHEGANLIASGL